MKLKKGVSLEGLVPQMAVALIVARSEYLKMNTDLIITSGNDGEHREYEIKTTLYHEATGKVAGAGVGMCSTNEKKYREYKDGSLRRPEDQYNTVLKMAKKRSHVDAILTATAASDIFTQDIEDGVNDTGYSAERGLALENLAFDLAKRCLESAGDEGDMKKFAALGKRVKMLREDQVKLLGELFEQRMNEFQEVNCEGIAN